MKGDKYMKNQAFTPEQLETIQLKVMALLVYVKTHDRKTLPYCFQVCERIVRNIDVSRSYCYGELMELTELIIEDWRIAFHSRVGLLDYCIPNDEPELQKSMNTAIHKQISDIEEYINK